MTPHNAATLPPAGAGSDPAAENRYLREHLAAARASVDRHQAELLRARRELSEAVAAAGRVALLEAEKADMAKLLVAGTALHASPDPDDVLGALEEILINLVGTERFAVLRFDAELLSPVVAFGVEDGEVATPPVARVFARVRETGETYLDVERADPGSPAACIPLCAGGEVAGLIAVLEFLPQKLAITPFDHDLYDLLKHQAAAALRACAARA